MAVTNQQVVTLLENVLFESSTQANANAASWAANPAANTVDSLAAAMASSGEANIALHIVGYYQTSLGRAPSAAEVSFYVGFAEHGLTSAQIAAGQVSDATWGTIAGFFANSPEFAARGHLDYSLGNTGAYLEAVPWLYQSVLGRTASTAELSFYDSQIANGANLGTLFTEFTSSKEFHSDTDAGITAALANFGTSTVDGQHPALVTLAPPPPAPSPAPAPAPVPASVDFTTGTDHFSALGAATVYNAILGGGSATLTANDTLSGLGNTLHITDTSGAASQDLLPSGVSLTGVATIILTTSGDAGTDPLHPFDLSGDTGLTSFTLNASGTSGSDFISARSGANIMIGTASALVSLDTAGTVAITDNALTDLDLSGSIGAVSLTDPSGSPAINIDPSSATVTSFTDASNQIQTLTISGNGGSVSHIGAITDTALVRLVVNGSSDVTLGSSSAPIALGANVTSIDTSAGTDIAGTNYFKLGSDNVVVILGNDANNIDLNGHTNTTIQVGLDGNYAAAPTVANLVITNQAGTKLEFGTNVTLSTDIVANLATLVSDFYTTVPAAGDAMTATFGGNTYIVESAGGALAPSAADTTIIEILGGTGTLFGPGSNHFITF